MCLRSRAVARLDAVLGQDGRRAVDAVEMLNPCCIILTPGEEQAVVGVLAAVPLIVLQTGDGG